MHPVQNFPSYFPKVYSNSFPSTPRSSKWSLPFSFQTKILYEFLIPPTRETYPAHIILLEMITIITLGEAYNLCSPSLCSHLQTSATSCLLGPNILLSTMFSNILNQCSSLSVRDQVSQPYKTKGKIIVLCI